MATSRRSLYQRLPEIYHIRDAEQLPPGQLQAYLDVIDTVQAGIRDNIEELYHDFFIETCDDWAIQYIADLLGTSHLAGDPWSLRADVARSIHHRRRKGTSGAIESLTYALSGWAVHAVELRERLVWNQHINHQRPDAGGRPPVPLNINEAGHISGAVRGGTVTLRDPALLSFLNGPFDPFAHVVDVKPLEAEGIRHSIPNLGIFLWRLEDYTVAVTRPVLEDNFILDLTVAAGPGEALYALRYELHSLAEPMVLFNTHRYQADSEPPDLTHADAVPGPMPRARLSQDTPAGNPGEYVDVDLYDTAPPDEPGDESVGLIIHLPAVTFSGFEWKYRGGNLCDWENGLRSPLLENEIVIDPDHGRIMIGVGGVNQNEFAEPLDAGIYISATYGFSGSTIGSTGAHPIMRPDTPTEWEGSSTDITIVNFHDDPNGLQNALSGLPATTGSPIVIEIQDSMIHELDVAALSLSRSLWIRAAAGKRPIIRLAQPLGFFPSDVTGPGGEALMENLNVKLEGLYITWNKSSPLFGVDTALIEQAALNTLTVEGCTLDPGNHEALNGTRQLVRYGMKLDNNYGFTGGSPEQIAFNQVPHIVIKRSICGPLAIDDGYTLSLIDSILDAANETDDVSTLLAVHATADPENQWGPDLIIKGMTCLGRMRVESATGEGGIWLHRLEVHDDQQGCIKFSYFSGDLDRLPQHHACVFGTEVDVSFVSDVFGQAGYGQLRLRSDQKILEQGPNRDAMGAFGYLLNTHKWKNINIRYREFMPVGIRPILLPVT
ncbi:MAG: hypothetical protein GY799_20640 [Desulfobulbaceae bacterium]|nr:hypothetical protein [Desulfobulbaceae bacterium]